MSTNIQVEEMPEVLDIDSFHLKLALFEFEENVQRRVGNIVGSDEPLRRKLVNEAIDYAQEHESVFAIARDTYLKGLRYIDMGNLVPLEHPKNRDLLRVPVKVTKERYRVFVGKQSSRLFRGETMPPNILSKIVMANTVCTQYQSDKDMYEYDLYICKGGDAMSDIGWRASESMYIVVLTQDELNELKGGKE